MCIFLRQEVFWQTFLKFCLSHAKDGNCTDRERTMLNTSGEHYNLKTYSLKNPLSLHWRKLFMYCYFNINNAPLMVVLGLLVQIHQTFRSWNPQSIPHHSWTKPSADMVEVFMKQQWKMSNNFWRSSVYFLHFCPTGWCIFRWVHDWNSFNCMSAVISWGGLGV